MAKKELSPEMRVVLAFGLSLLILIFSRPLLVRETPPAQKPAQKPATAANEGAKPEQKPTVAEVKPATEQASSEPAAETVKQGEREEQITVISSLYRVVVSTRGAVAKSWQLT